MAFHKHFKLPPFKLTHRSRAGVQVRDLHRSASGVPLPRNSSAERDSLAEDKSAPEFSQPQPLEPWFSSLDPCAHLDEPSHHELQSIASVKGWEKLRKGMLSAAVEGCAMPIGQVCILCSEQAVVRCQECGPLIHYCLSCFYKQHEKANFFHIAEKWEVN